MRILVLSNLYPPDVVGGYELLCARSAERWARAGHHVTVLARRAAPPSGMVAGVRVQRSFRPIPRERARGGRIARAAWLFRERRIVERSLEQVRPDVIASWGTYGIAPSALAAAFGSKTPSIAYTQDYSMIDYATRPAPDVPSHGPRRPYLRVLTSIPGEMPPRPLPSRWVFASAVVRAEYERTLGPLDGRVIHNGIRVPGSVPPLPPRGPRLRVGGLGRLVPEKGWLTLVAAAQRLAEEDASSAPEVEIHGAETDPGFAATLHQAADRARAAGAPVTVDGPIAHDQVDAFIARMDCIAIPSEWEEPFGLVMIEALAAGRPLVAARRGFPGAFLEDGSTALLHPSGDHEALARALQRLAREPRLADRIAAAGLERVREECSLERTEAEIDQALVDAAGSRS